MSRIAGKVICDGTPAADAYVQLRDKDNDFVGETRADLMRVSQTYMQGKLPRVSEL